ncbi:MAG: hypothetical protein ACREJ3_14280, partial [Polyangiaceae bacterium]
GDMVTLGLGDSVAGPILQNKQVTLPPLSVPLSFPPSSGNVTIALGQSGVLAPGSYGKVTVYGSLTLAAGTYYVENLDIEPFSTVTLDKTSGPVVLDVQSQLSLGAPMVDHGSHPGSNILVNYVGTLPLVFSVPFTGTLASPNASVLLGAVLNGGHTGVFLAHGVVVAGAVITRQAFDPACP